MSGLIFVQSSAAARSRYPRGAEGVVADLGGDAGPGGAAADHGVGVSLRQWRGGQHRPPPLDGAEQRSLGIAAQGAAVEIGVQIGLQGMVAGHFGVLVTFVQKVTIITLLK